MQGLRFIYKDDTIDLPQGAHVSRIVFSQVGLKQPQSPGPYFLMVRNQ